MTPAEIMGSVYRGLLRRIELDKFRVFEKDYQLNQDREGRSNRRATFQIFFESAAANIRLTSRLRT